MSLIKEDPFLFCLLVLIGGILILGVGYIFVYLIVTGVHDTLFQQEEYKTESLLLNDVQYMDDEKILYRFGDLVVEDKLISSNFYVDRTYDVVFVRYTNSWQNKNGVWIYEEIKEN